MRAQRQTGYRIIVDTDEEKSNRASGAIWDSGKVASDETLQIRYEGMPLVSGQRYYWKVMAWDGGDAASEWSGTAWFETGLLDAGDWQGEWIGGNSSYNSLDGSRWIWHELNLGEDAEGNAETGESKIAFRRTFRVPTGKRIRQAIFHGTCGSLFTLFVNGSTIAKLNKRWKQDWSSPFYYIDFTSKLLEGDNCLVCEVVNTDSEHAGFIASFELHYEDGSAEKIITDSTWATSDAGATGEGWKLAGYEDSAWPPAKPIAEFGDQPWGRIKRRGPAPLVRKEFAIAKTATRARLYVCSLGYFELTLNGKRLGDGLSAAGLYAVPETRVLPDVRRRAPIGIRR